MLVLPEDDANRQMANGFLLELDQSVHRRIQVLEEAGGWTRVRDRFLSDHVGEMNRYPNRHMVLLVDFDDRIERLRDVMSEIPEYLASRVFVLGALSDPERLKASLGCPYEAIGQTMARDCRDNTDTIWGHEILLHNKAEIDRLRRDVRLIRFPDI